MQHRRLSGHIVPVVLAGGQGRRLRPLTAPSRPKPLLPGRHGKSLLYDTLSRCAGFDSPVIICTRGFEQHMRNEALKAGSHDAVIIAEPCGRSTALAIATAAQYLKNQDAQNTYMLVMPSDAQIECSQTFCKQVLAATQWDDDLILFGAMPTDADIRYGYMRIQNTPDGLRLVLFEEKPTRKHARQYIAAGSLWNTGIFLCRADAFLHMISRYEPLIKRAAELAVMLAGLAPGILYPDRTSYEHAPSMSVDRAVMEHCRGTRVIRLDCGWRDVGVWRDYARFVMQYTVQSKFFAHK